VHVTLRQLSVFESVARHLSYTRAAEELHLSQPAVSMQVRQLEESVGLPLFEKVGKRIHLTEAGHELFLCSQRIGQQLREAEDIFTALKGVRRGHLHLSVPTTANYFATRLLSAFTREYSGVTFSLEVLDRNTLVERLVGNDTDMALMGKPPDVPELHATAFMENPLVVIAPPGHALAEASGPIPLSRVEAETFVMREPTSGTRIAVEHFFAEQGIVLRAGLEMTSNEAIKQAVETGLGLGIVSRHTLNLELETARLVVLDVAHFPILRHWHVVHSQNKRLSPVAQAFEDFLLRPQTAALAHPTTGWVGASKWTSSASDCG
jgi:DNA-binding transcriptional LysR family regulator